MRRLVLACTAILALAAALPAAEAREDACVALTNASCPGVVCVDADGNRAFTHDECAPDGCTFQSDCCPSATGPGFWCPPDS